MTNFARIAVLARRAPDLERGRDPVPAADQSAAPCRIRKSAGESASAAGFLRLPDGPGPSPAVVLLHGCQRSGGGSTSVGASCSRLGLCHADRRQLRSARHHEHLHGRAQRSTDATTPTARWTFWSRQPSVDPTRVAVVGFSARRPCWRCSSVERGHHRTASTRQIPRGDRASIRPASVSRAT